MFYKKLEEHSNYMAIYISITLNIRCIQVLRYQHECDKWNGKCWKCNSLIACEMKRRKGLVRRKPRRVLLSLFLIAGLSTWLQRSWSQQRNPAGHWRFIKFSSRQPLWAVCSALENNAFAFDGNFVKQLLPRHMYPWGTHSGWLQ